MGDVVSKLGDGLWNAFLMAWEVWWALVLGFAISAIVQAWVPRERIEYALRRRPRPVADATGARGGLLVVLLRRDRDRQEPVPEGRVGRQPLAFQFASTNLVWELGLVLWVLIGWQFALAEYLGGLVMIALMWALLRLFVSPRGRGAGARPRPGGGRRAPAPLGRG